MAPAPDPRRPPAWRRYLSFWGADIGADVDEELRFHLEMRAAEYAARGLTPDAARSRAEQRFGNVHRAREACSRIDRQQARAETHMQMLIAVRQDTVYALRVLRRQWLPALAAVLCTAVGVSATTAMFSIANTLLLRPLPYPNGDRLVTISTARIGVASSIGVSSYLDYRDWRASQHSFDEMGAIGQTNFVMLGREPRRVSAALVSASFFPTLGVIPDPWRYPSRTEAWLPISTGGYTGFSNGVLDPSSRGNRNLEVLGALRRGV